MDDGDQNSSILGRKLKHSDYSSLSESGTLQDLDESDVDSFVTNVSQCEIVTQINVSDNFNFITKSLYRCKLCDVDVKLKSMRDHWTIHCRTEYCDGCKKKYTKQGFSKHKCQTSTFCFRCQKKFGSRSKLEAHFRKHDLDDKRKTLPKTQWKRFTCEICNESLQMRCYTHHMKNHNETLTCEFCEKRVHKRYFDNHRNNCVCYCKICDKHIHGIDKYNSHLENHKNDYGCLKCDLKFPYLVHMAYHYSDQHCEVKHPFYQCVICDKKVKALAAHLRTHSKKSVDCEICSKTLPNYSAYKEHLRYHKQLYREGINREIVPKIEQGINEMKNCTQCDQKFKTLSELYRHFESHLKMPSVICPKCNEEFIKVDDLTLHISQNHFNMKDNKVKCLQCTKVVPDLFRHTKIHESPKFECESCGIPFYSIRKLYKHYNMTHGRLLTDLTPLQKMQRIYKDKYELEIRRLSKFKYPWLLRKNKPHTTVKCLLCKKLVYRPNYARWTHHFNYECKFRQEKMLKKCSICMKICLGDSMLKQHMTDHENSYNNHTGDISLHSCPLCSQSFLSHIRLKAHLVRCHSLNHVSSRTCNNC